MARSSFIIVFCFYFFRTVAQPLPLYERNQQGEFYLLRSDSIQYHAQLGFKSITVLSVNGIEKKENLKDIHLASEKECCTHPDPWFEMGSINWKPKNENEKIVYIAGDIDDGKLWSNSISQMPDAKIFLKDEFNQTLIGKSFFSDYSYRWKQQSNGKIYFEEQEQNESEGVKAHVETFEVNLQTCLYEKHDSFEVLTCKPDSVDEYAIYSPWWVLTYLNHQLLDARMDYSHTSSDGYGAFHYQAQNPIGWYKAGDDFFLLCNPGYVLQLHTGKWTWEYRDACLYYGECDCGE